MEKLMQYVWEHRLGLRQDMQTVDGRRVRIIDQGLLNHDAGPDFFNATVEIDGQIWVGNIEIHVRASDWFRHHHDTDPAYDSIILHVVQIDDMPIHRRSGAVIPQMIMHCTAEAARRCNLLVSSADSALPCRLTINELHPIYHSDWITALGAERLLTKSERILSIVKESAGFWDSAAYITLARGLGFGLNSEPFELLAKSLSLRFLEKHRHELVTVEALVFGQAGLIPMPCDKEDEYITRLREEYAFMARKYSLKPIPPIWKMARTRPQNFPHRRLAILAFILHQGCHLMRQIVDAKTYDEMKKIFDLQMYGFWATHFTFDPCVGARPQALSKASVDTLIINFCIPLRQAYATYRGETDNIEDNIEILRQIPPENNSIIRLFSSTKIPCKDAFTSQALIQLRREYCEKRKCIYCRFGSKMLSAEIQK